MGPLNINVFVMVLERAGRVFSAVEALVFDKEVMQIARDCVSRALRKAAHAVQGRDTLLVSFGGNALKDKGQEDVPAQNVAVQRASGYMAQIFSKYNLATVHGNGPQVGFMALRVAIASNPKVAELLCQSPMHHVPLDALVANTQGAIGYMFDRHLMDELNHLDPRLRERVICVLTRVLVDPNDPAFKNPSKPVGPFMTEEDKNLVAAENPDWEFSERTNRDVPEKCWRRVVASPEPKRIIGVDIVRDLVRSGCAVTCGGGGGIPMRMDGETGKSVGVEAVIDKDNTSRLIAEGIGAKKLVIVTGSAGVVHPQDWERGSREVKHHMLPDEAQCMAPFLEAGSMGPKVSAAADFAYRTGYPAVITDFDGLLAVALGDDRRVGTWIC